MGPLVIAALAGAGFFLYEKMRKSKGVMAGPSGTTVAQTSFAVDAPSGHQFAAQAVGNGTVDVFLMPSGTRIVRFDPATKTEIISPPNTDPTIKAAALRAFGISPKAG